MAWIEPLQLEIWIVNVFSGSLDIFSAIALLVIAGLAGYFGMSVLTMILMIAIFALMFTEYVTLSFITIIAIIGGLLIGYWISRIVK
jgi:uncharacterized membrane protein YqgA involved in biofilm formation